MTVLPLRPGLTTARAAAERTDARIDQLTTTVINLAESLGQVKGRTETLIATE